MQHICHSVRLKNLSARWHITSSFRKCTAHDNYAYLEVLNHFVLPYFQYIRDELLFLGMQRSIVVELITYSITATNNECIINLNQIWTYRELVVHSVFATPTSAASCFFWNGFLFQAKGHYVRPQTFSLFSFLLAQQLYRNRSLVGRNHPDQELSSYLLRSLIAAILPPSRNCNVFGHFYFCWHW